MRKALLTATCAASWPSVATSEKDMAQAPAVVQEGPEAKKARHQRLLDAVKEWDATRKARSEEKREMEAKKMAEEMLESLRERD